MLLPWLTIFDARNFLANFIKPVAIRHTTKDCDDFMILIPIFNDVAYLKNISFLGKYSRHVILCTTDKEGEGFYTALEKIAEINNFKIHKVQTGEATTKNPWSIFKHTLVAHELVIKDTLKNVGSKFVILLDGDTTTEESFYKLCGVMEEHNFDIASVRIVPSKRETIMERLQGIEYDVAMQARLIYPWLTSGACMVAKVSTLKDVLVHHSLFFSGGDIEIGKLAVYSGYHVGHIRFTLFTDVPATFKAWWKQRTMWWAGAFRHAVINFRTNWRHPFFLTYFSLIVWFLLPFKLYESFLHWWIIPTLMLLYIPLSILVNYKVKSVRSWPIILFSFYAWLQIFILIWLGMIRYLKIFLKTKNAGIIKFRHSEKPSNSFRISDVFIVIKRVLTLCCLIFLIIFLTSYSLQVAILHEGLTDKTVSIVKGIKLDKNKLIANSANIGVLLWSAK